MAWRCPACRSTIPHNTLDSRPREDEAYRCIVCRLDLLFDPVANELVLAPLTDDHDIPTKRAIPLLIEPRKGRPKYR